MQLSLALIVALLVPSVVMGCKPGFKPSDVPGVCIEIAGQSDANWMSNEKPPSEKMPSWQREGISIVNCPSTTKEDEDADKAKLDATQEGKRLAGIRE